DMGVVRDHLAEQTEDDELRADDDEQHAERQQRPMADRLAEHELGERQIGVDQKAQPEGNDTDQAKQMQRSARVLRQEQHRQQIEEAAEEARRAELRMAVTPRTMWHGHL